MHTFFYGWRRKAGCVTLFVACVAMGLWLRSLFIEDTVIFFDGFGHQTLNSLNGSLYWDSQMEWTFDPGSLTWFTLELRNSEMLAASMTTWNESFLIPDWSIVIPLTLLSAYLIRCTPRNRI